MKAVIDTRQDEELHLSKRDDGTVKFSMTEITVDGMTTKRPVTRLFDHYLFTLKEEETEKGEVADTGYPWHYIPEFIVSEKHWLKCDEVLQVGKRCHVCGEVAE